MILLRQIRQYKKDTLLTPLFAGVEVIMEVLLPFITARIIDEGLNGENLSAVYRYGALMVVMAMLSLLFGTLAGKYAASASSGFACNLRESLYEKIRTFSFSNIDKFCRKKVFYFVIVIARLLFMNKSMIFIHFLNFILYFEKFRKKYFIFLVNCGMMSENRA